MTNTPQTVLVTGGGGFLGKAIIKRLLERGDQVRSLARGDYPDLRELGVTVIQGDLRDAQTVADAAAGCDLIFHVAAKVGVWGAYQDFYDINVGGTENILAACRTHGIQRLVYTSSPSVVFDSGDMEGADESVPYPETYQTHYPQTKAEAERRVKAAAAEGLRAVILRPHLIWGPEDNHLVPRILSRHKSLRIIGDGKNTIDTVYIDNAADAHIQAADVLLTKPEIAGRAYFITQDEPINAWEMINLILEAGGKSRITKSIPYKTARRIGAMMETTYRTLRIKKEPRLTPFVVDELSKSHWFDISAARRDLGYDPKISTKEGLRRLQAWLRPQ